MMKKFLLITSLTALVGGCAATKSNESPSAEHLLGWMQGSFNSAKQAGEDKSYFNIYLNMVEIWPEDENGPWLYVEQAAHGYLEKPYRQRVYQLKDLGNGRFESKVYTFDNPLDFAGDWKTQAPLAKLKPENLALKPGCSVFLTWQSEQKSYSGATNNKDCVSKLRGAEYATSIVTIYEDRVESWDQGFDGSDKQVWGATKAGYIFDRL